MVSAAMIQRVASMGTGRCPPLGPNPQPAVPSRNMRAIKPAVLGTKASIAETGDAAPW